MRRVLAISALLLFGSTLSACGENEPPVAADLASTERQERSEVTVVTREFSFDVPATVGEGDSARFTVRNEGKQAHHAIVYRLLPGASANELGARLIANEQGISGLAEQVGGSRTVGPGEEEWFGVGQALSPGSYAVACFLQDQSKSTAEKTHVELGMIEFFEVI